MSYSKIIGTPLSQLSDDDTVKEVIQKIARNQQSLYVQMMEIVKFFNAIYSPDVDGETTFTSVINAGNIVRVTVKNGILYIAYKTDNDLRDVIKFKLSEVDIDPDDGDSGTGKSGFIDLKHKGEELPDPDDYGDKDYVFKEGDGLYQKEEGDWVKKDEIEVYLFYDNSIYHYIDGVMTTVVETSSKAKDMRVLQVDGIILNTSNIRIEDGVYTGDNGTVLLYPGSVSDCPEVLMAVQVDNGREVYTEYYKEWAEVGAHPDSAEYNVKDWNKASFVWKDGSDLHMGSISGVGEVTELGGSTDLSPENSTNKTIKVSKNIKVWGDNYNVRNDWKVGDLWYDVSYDSATDTYTKILKECISDGVANLQPSFSVISFAEGVLYYVEQNHKWYAYNGQEPYEISNNAIREIRVIGENYDQIVVNGAVFNNIDWHIGQLWYNNITGELKECVSMSGDTPLFDDISLDTNTLYKYVFYPENWYAMLDGTLTMFLNIELLNKLSQAEQAIAGLEQRVSALES